MSQRLPLLFSVFGAIIVIVVSMNVLASGAKRRAESRQCANAMTSICLAGRLWAEDHGGNMPTNFICMKDKLATPKILACRSARRAQNWSSFGPTNCTYEIVAPGMPASETNRVFLRCKIHGHKGYSDGTVFDGVRRRGKFG